MNYRPDLLNSSLSRPLPSYSTLSENNNEYLFGELYSSIDKYFHPSERFRNLISGNLVSLRDKEFPGRDGDRIFPAESLSSVSSITASRYLPSDLISTYTDYYLYKMNLARNYPSVSQDYDRITSHFLNDKQFYPENFGRHHQQHRLPVENSLDRLTSKGPESRHHLAALREYEESLRDYSSSTTSSGILDVSRDSARSDKLSKDQSLSGFSRSFGTIPRDCRLSRESLDRVQISRTPPSRSSQTPPSFHSSTPPLRQSQPSPLRHLQASPSSSHTPPLRSRHSSTPPGVRPPPSYKDATSNRQSPMSPNKHQYRSAEEYHYDYRGGYRPADSNTDGGYTTDGSGSIGLECGSLRGILDSGSIKGFSNLLYAENETLLPRNRSSFPPYYPTGSSYAKADTSVCGGERQPFLSNVEPVRLTPSWEQANPPKQMTKTVSTFDTFEGETPPRDRLALVFLTLTLHGVGTLMPWNMFITAYPYFVDYKLIDEHNNRTEYANNFLTYVGYASQLPNVLFNWINVFVQLRGDITTRIVWSILIEVVLFIFTVVLAMLNTTDWIQAFFWITMVTIVIINSANAIFQNSVYGMAGRLPFKYTGAVILGSNISGTFTALIQIIALLLAPDLRTSAIYYFITAIFILLACFDTYFALPLIRFFRYHDYQYEKSQKALTREKGSNTRVPYWHIFCKAFPQLLNVFMIFFVTLAVFPAVLADTCRTEENFFIPTKLFQVITCFLTFNLMAMLGNMLPGLCMRPGPKFLCIPVWLRLLFIPAFLLCHYYPVSTDASRIMPVLIDSDWAYWVLSMFLGLTSGYFSSLAMMYCPQTVEPEYAPVAGMMGAASLVTGIFAGINFQMVCSWLVTHVTFDIPGLENTMRNCTH